MSILLKMKRIITDKQGNEYVLLLTVVGNNYLVPYDGRKYWEHHFIPKNTWVSMSTIDYDKFNFTQEEYDAIVKESDKKHVEILAKYHASF